MMKRILVVDDEVKIVELVSDYLKRAGYDILSAYDGESALEKVRREKPDLIILDLGLPKMDGLDVTRSIRQSSVAPIIMLTARSDESDKLIGLELGADDYITKPFSPKELVARVRVVFRRMETY
ncbi:MAG: response regulator, partial [Chloroflexota bacterium]|nr:response regulator [Chloroflexota bacterium]